MVWPFPLGHKCPRKMTLIDIQWERLHLGIHQVVPVGAASRRRPPIWRRVYSVPCPDYIWHIDGNHKLIRWRMVLHHAFDGFSPLVVFGMFSNNNRASTVLSLYQAAFRKYGRLFRVRTDHGGENVDVWHDMVGAWGENARSVVVRIWCIIRGLNATTELQMSS